MANGTASFSLNQHARYRLAIRDYLAHLPVLDGRVLQQHYSEKKDPAGIARDMGISINHVNRILTRAGSFNARVLAGEVTLPAPPVWTCSPIAMC
jgi:DNA-directed RNA polymerase specialized sigma24 family protein